MYIKWKNNNIQLSRREFLLDKNIVSLYLKSWHKSKIRGNEKKQNSKRKKKLTPFWKN